MRVVVKKLTKKEVFYTVILTISEKNTAIKT